MNDAAHSKTPADAKARDSQESDDLERLVAGDKATWDRFVARYAPFIFAAVQRRLIPAGRGDGIEDAVQDVFLRLCAKDFRLLKTYDGTRAKLSTWLTVVATSTAIDHLRKQRGHTTPIDTVPESAVAVDAIEPAWVNIPADLLSPRQTLVIELLYRKELDTAEAATALGVNPQTIRSMHHKALLKLRAHFQESEP